MKIQSVTYRIILSMIIAYMTAGVVMMAMFVLMALQIVKTYLSPWVVFGLPCFLIAPLVTAIAFWRLTPPLAPDGHTRCGKCGYILKGLREPRCPRMWRENLKNPRPRPATGSVNRTKSRVDPSPGGKVKHRGNQFSSSKRSK